MATQLGDVIATTGHVGINVTVLDRCVGFYCMILGLDVLNRGDEPGRRFVFLGANGKLVLTLLEQATAPFSATAAGLHLSFQVGDVDAVRSAEGCRRLRRDFERSHAELS